MFASLYGTVKLLEPEEQALIRGLIINKFRGDVEILRPAWGSWRRSPASRCWGGAPCWTWTWTTRTPCPPGWGGGRRRAWWDIAVVRLPRLSNFTDFNPLERMEEVSLRYVGSVKELGGPTW